MSRMDVDLDRWSVCVSGNCRVVFRFDDGEAVDVERIQSKRLV